MFKAWISAMTTSRRGGVRLGLALALAFGLAAPRAESAGLGDDEPAAVKKAPAKGAGQVPKKKSEAKKAEPAAKVVLPDRPARRVEAPTLTSPELDRLLAIHLKKNDPKVEPAPLTSDVEYVRRIYFDLAGKPPTAEQVDFFVRNRAKDKRERLVDVLLQSPEYARNWAKYWRDVVKFHATVDNIQRIRLDLLEDWLAKQFAANRPWDQIAASMITATGRNDENGAVAFAMAHQAQPVELAGEASRIFMGVQIQCAQCHDHKTDSWKQKQFHEFAAFFAGVRERQVVKPEPGQPPVFAVQPLGSRRYTMPDKNDPKKRIPIAPRFFLASAAGPAPAIPELTPVPERRALVASYITGQDNPWFAKAYINRVWYALMGEAFYEPIDDIGPERTAKGGEILDVVAREWQNGGYDVRWLFRLIVNTESYQRRVRSTANAAGKTPFASNCPSRMRADQLFDELAQALALPLDKDGNFFRPGTANRPGAADKPQSAAKPPAKTLVSYADAKPGAKPAASDKAALKAGFAALKAKNPAPAARFGGPRGQFERVFGIDPSVANDDVTGTIPQALYLMNGPLVSNRTQARPGTLLGEILTAAPNDRAALGALYLRVLSRQPTTHEVEVCGKYMAAVGNRREAFEDVYWSLINTTEFLTRR